MSFRRSEGRPTHVLRVTCAGYRRSCTSRRACGTHLRPGMRFRPAPSRRPPHVGGAGSVNCRCDRVILNPAHITSSLLVCQAGPAAIFGKGDVRASPEQDRVSAAKAGPRLGIGPTGTEEWRNGIGRARPDRYRTGLADAPPSSAVNGRDPIRDRRSSFSSTDDTHVLRLDPDRVHERLLPDHAPDVELEPADRVPSADLELAADGKLKDAPLRARSPAHVRRHDLNADGITDARPDPTRHDLQSIDCGSLRMMSPSYTGCSRVSSSSMRRRRATTSGSSGSQWAICSTRRRRFA